MSRRRTREAAYNPIVNCQKNATSRYWQRTELSNYYFEDIRQYPILDKSETLKLIKKAQAGGPDALEARNKIVSCNQRFVLSVARNWHRSHNLLDLVNEGNLGLIRAIELYDVTRTEQSFLSYAVFWIRKKILKYVDEMDKVVIPKNSMKQNTYVPKARAHLLAVNEYNPSDEEIKEYVKEHYGVTFGKIADKGSYSISSIDEERENCDGKTYVSNEFEVATASDNVSDAINASSEKETVRKLLTCLDERERYIIQNNFGIDCEEKSIDDIAKDLDLSRERVRQLYRKALYTMKNKGKKLILAA